MKLYLSLLKRIIIIIKFYLILFECYHLSEQTVTIDYIEGTW